MRTVTFQSVLHAVARAAGLDPARGLDSVLAANLTSYIQRRFNYGWDYDFWSEWTLCEERQYQPDYDSATAYTAPTLTASTFRYFIPTGKYYQVLRASTGNDPATLSSGAYVENSAYWAEAAFSYNGEDWSASTVYAVGDKVRNILTGRYYQCHTAHTSAGTFDATKFGILTPFDRFIALDQTGETPIGTVKAVWQRNPRIERRRPFPVAFTLSNDGIQVAQNAPALVWVEFRKRPPQFTSTPYVSTTAYTAGQYVYYGTTGECYKALTSTTGNAPTNTTYWEKQDFPYLLDYYVQRTALADLLRSQKQTSRANSEEELGLDELYAANTRDQEQQGAMERAGVQTYGT